MPRLKRSRREMCQRERLSTSTTRMLLCQILNGWKRKEVMQRRRRRGRWQCCLLAGKARNPSVHPFVICPFFIQEWLDNLRDVTNWHYEKSKTKGEAHALTFKTSLLPYNFHVFFFDRFQVAQIPEHNPTVVEVNKTSAQEQRNSLFLGKPFCSTLTGIRRYESFDYAVMDVIIKGFTKWGSFIWPYYTRNFLHSIDNALNLACLSFSGEEGSTYATSLKITSFIKNEVIFSCCEKELHVILWANNFSYYYMKQHLYFVTRQMHHARSSTPGPAWLEI